MKIDRFNIPDFNSFNSNEVKNVKNEEAGRADFSSRLESTQSSTQSSSSPLHSELTGIAKGTDFNNSISSRVALDKAARAIVGDLISPDLKNKVNMDKLMSAMSDFAQSDPVLSNKLQKL